MPTDEYDDETFEEDEEQTPFHGERGSWKTIDFEEVELGEQLGGGSVGLVHRGTYSGEAVALKILVSDDLAALSSHPCFITRCLRSSRHRHILYLHLWYISCILFAGISESNYSCTA